MTGGPAGSVGRSSTNPLHVLFACLAGALFVLGPGPARAAFQDVTVSYGIASGDSMSYTASFQDYDADGDQDFLVNNHWKNGTSFYRNDGDTPWLDVSSFLGTGNADRHDGLWGDFDNNGSPDLYLCRGHEQDNDFFRNMGAGVMIEDGVAAGVNDYEGRGREVTLADFNLDGFLDIFLVNDFRSGFKKPSRMFLNNGDGTFFTFPNTTPLFFSRLHVSSADFDLDGDPDLLMTNPPYASGELWRNDGSAVFTEVRSTAFAGIADPLLQANGLSWADYDNDGDLDLLACGGNRAMWDYAAVEGDSLRWYAEADMGEKKGVRFVTEGDSVTVYAGSSTWEAVTCRYGGSGASTTTFPVKLSVADIAGEPPLLSTGLIGLYVWSTPASPGDSIHVTAQNDSTKGTEWIVGGSLRANGPGIGGWEEVGLDNRPGFADGNFTNRLFRNEGDGTFAEVTSTAFAVNDSTASSLGAAWGDYDCDGHLDVYVTNSGNIETGNIPNYLYRNNGDGTFTEVAAAEGVQGSTRGLGDGAAFADVNEDGFLDLYVDNGAEHPPFGVGPRELFENLGNGNHWLQFDLRCFSGNGSGIGAQVQLVTPSGKQFRTVLGETDNCFSGPLTVHFGLGADDHADSLVVTWPGGAVSAYSPVPADQRYWAIEGKPLRVNQNPHFVCLPLFVSSEVLEGESVSWNVNVDNYGGQACTFGAHYEACDGTPISWLSVDPDTGAVWPGGSGPFQVTADATALAPGAYCGRVIFETKSFLGPDTLAVNIQVLSVMTGAPSLPGAAPSRLSLGSVRPNPGRGAVSASLGLPREGRVSAAIYDVTGRRVATLLDGPRPAGWHTVSWSGRGTDGARAAGGVYLLRVDWGTENITRKVVLLD
ncbi:FG-GAP-like repeat-containing protein [bacterium]|nr:FG-GAP-like repeat-containing protein [bacterium]